jgi:sugar lactone lactonase YvrE
MKRTFALVNVAIFFCCLLMLPACGGGGGAPSASLPTSTNGKKQTTAGNPETVWLVDENGTLGTGGVTAYNVTVGSNTITAIPGDAVNESRPNINSNPAGVNAPQAMAFDSKGNLWVANQLSDLVVAITLGSNGVTPKISLPSGVTFPNADPSGLGFDSKGNLWIGGPQYGGGLAWTYQAQSVAANLSSSPILTSVPDPTGNGSVPYGLAFDPSGNLWTQGASALGVSPADGVQEYTLSGGTATAATFIQTQGCNTPFTFDAGGNLWCVNPGPTYTTPEVEEFTVPGGTKTASFAVPFPTGVDVTSSYIVNDIRFDPSGTLWVLVEGSSPLGIGGSVASYAALLALNSTGTVLSSAVLPNETSDYYPDFIFQP